MLPTLDLPPLPAQLAAASQIFHDHKQLPMLPVNQIDEDAEPRRARPPPPDRSPRPPR